LEGITRNYFFIVINLIMIGGQILIVFVGREAFKIVPLDGKEWGLSIGLGALSLPWGAAIRKFPDEWVVAALPRLLRKQWAPETIGEGQQKEHEPESEEFRPPLRVMTTIRGPRARNFVGFRQRMHDAKERVKERAKDKIHNGKNGSSSDVEKR
jgi:P-type Ca2+ transporter type 2C